MQKPAQTRPPNAARVPDLEVAAPFDGELRPAGDAPVSLPHSTPPQTVAPREIGGPSGPEPTRFGDWERKGRCIDF